MSGWWTRRSEKKRAKVRESAPDHESRQAYEIERLKQENEKLRNTVGEQAKQMADLQRQLALRQQNSTTSSKPPRPTASRVASASGAAARKVAASRAANSAIPDTAGPWCQPSA